MTTTTTWAAAAVLAVAAACSAGTSTADPTTTTTSPVAGWCADWQALGRAPAGEEIGAVAEAGAALDVPAVAGPAGVIVTALAGGRTTFPGGQEWTVPEAMAELDVYCETLR